MNFLSICSGIEAASAAFGPLGWKAVGFSEIEPFPCAVLAHHYPDVPNLGDMSRYLDWPQEVFAQADAIVGGPPCQAFSTAGLRAGLNDGRGNLTLTFARLINHADAVRLQYGKPPVVILYENVPGLLSDKTNAFGCLLAALVAEDAPLEPPGGKWRNAGLVFGPQRAVAWRILDAQHFGLAQRRRRVFLVASAGDGFDPAAVLFEFDGVRRDTAPSREAGKVAPTIPSRSTGGGGLGTDFDCDGGVITMAHGQGGAEIGFDRGPTLTCNHEAPIAAYGIRTAQTGSNGWGIQEEITHTLDGTMGIAVAHSLRGEGFDASEDGTGRGTPLVPVSVAMRGRDGGAACEVGDDCAFTLRASGGGGDKPHVLAPVAFDTTQITSAANYSNPQPGDLCHPLAAGAHAPVIAFPANLSGTQHASTENLAPSMGAKNPTAVQTAMQVRRLTPRECERLMGFKDDYTAIPWRGKPADQCPDRPRYKSLGNSWPVPVVAWIGARIQAQVAVSAQA